MWFAAGLRNAYRSASYHVRRYNAACAAASRAAAAAAAASSSPFRAFHVQGGHRSIADYARAFQGKKQSARDAIRARLRPRTSILDFSLRYHSSKSPSYSGDPAAQLHWTWQAAKRTGRLHPRHLPLDAQAKRYKLRMLLLEAYTGRSLKHTQQSCPAHGRERTTPFCGGFGGGRYRIEFDHARWRACRAHYRRAHHHHRRRRSFRVRQGPCPLELATWFIDRQLDRGCRKIQHLNKLAPPAISLQSHTSTSSNSGTHNSGAHESNQSYRGKPLNTSGCPRPWPFQARLGSLATPPWPVPHAFGNLAPAYNLGAARFVSTSSCKKGPEMLLKAAFLLKSSTALHWINLLFRISVSVIPLSIKRASWARKARLAQLATGAVATTPYWATAFKIICRSALALPFVLLAAVLLIAIERTPITGRLRLLLLNQDEELDIVNKVLDIGEVESLGVTRDDQWTKDIKNERDWLTIMRTVLGEDNAPEGTLLGGQVLSPADWRTGLVEHILTKLERGIPALKSSEAATLLEIQPPPLSYPLGNSARCTHLRRRNAVLVVDRPESNAFSFGFYGSVDEPHPGVIIVFTGAIDEIMASGIRPNQNKPTAQPGHSNSSLRNDIQEPGWLRSFFGSLLAPPELLNDRSEPAISPLSHAQEEALAVLIAHELAHLVLSHTIESYANTALLWPQLEKLGWDMLRVFIYPVTAILGPFVQDAISATVKVGIEESAEGRGLLPALTSSCESKKLEYEADTVALRLLANAGIDPRSAIRFWEERLRSPATTLAHAEHDHAIAHHDNPGLVHGEVRRMHEVYCENDAETESFIRTHPADHERILAIKRELATWRKVAPVPT